MNAEGATYWVSILTHITQNLIVFECTYHDRLNVFISQLLPNCKLSKNNNGTDTNIRESIKSEMSKFTSRWEHCKNHSRPIEWPPTSNVLPLWY